ncbi:hypothetical protein V5N11_021807 [Cardamine amara subsp. amara]|uniref:Vitellogenin-like protein n=1 Tax=Cardamine amara subsp. amara TaxID=228776 RepID=A0ABD1ATZ7_CARAN
MVEMKDQDMVDGMQCINHPFTKNPGGICAFCLQEKLGKLVTSSFPLPKHLSSSSSSSSPSFRSDSVGNTTTTSAANLSASLSLSVSGARNVSNNNNKIPFLLAKKKKKVLTASASASSTANVVYKRSQSTRTTRDSDLSPRKRNGFWSFLHLYSSKQHSSSKKVGNFHQPISQTEAKTEKGDLTETTMNVGSSSSSSSSASSSMSKRVNGAGVSSNRSGIDVIVEEDGSPNIEVTPSERKVSRSRSVGCGSRSFSGDFFERITNGFGDCTLRRVESQREGNKGKVSNSSNNPSNGAVREMVRCGGIFGGFMIMTSSSSSSSSSSWVSSSSAEHHQHHNHHNMGHHAGGRNRSWGWAFASPMRAFSSSSGKRGRTISDSTSKNTTPNLSAIPSLLAVRN